jgi:hypothetical protein
MAVPAEDVHRISTAMTTAAGTKAQINAVTEIACTEAFTTLIPLVWV